MKRYQLITLLLLLVLSLSMPACATVQKTSAPTLNLEFESADDLAEINFPSGTEHLIDESMLVKGVFHLEWIDLPSAVIVDQPLEPGQLVHYRVRSAADGPCFCTEVAFAPDPTQDRGIRLDSCPGNPYEANAVWNRDHLGDSISRKLPADGVALGLPNEWADMIFWLHPDSDKVYYLTAAVNTPKYVLYGAVSLPGDWQPDNWYTGIDIFFEDDVGTNQYVDVDFIHIANGPLPGYLNDNLPAYLENREEIDQFFDQPPEPMPEVD